MHAPRSHLYNVHDIHIEVLHGECVAACDGQQVVVPVLQLKVLLNFELALTLGGRGGRGGREGGEGRRREGGRGGREERGGR